MIRCIWDGMGWCSGVEQYSSWAGSFIGCAILAVFLGVSLFLPSYIRILAKPVAEL